MAFQGALRRLPWEWVPGFHAEAVLGYKRIDGEARGSTKPRDFAFSNGNGLEFFTNHAFETGAASPQQRIRGAGKDLSVRNRGSAPLQSAGGWTGFLNRRLVTPQRTWAANRPYCSTVMDLGGRHMELLQA